VQSTKKFANPFKITRKSMAKFERMPLDSDIMKEKFLKARVSGTQPTPANQVFMSDRMRAFKKITDWKQRTEIIHERPDG
jgi:hypothetical protein